MPNSEKEVCSQSWQGVHDTTITLKNENIGAVTVSKSSDSNILWPFEDPSISFTVPGKSGNNPGTASATLVNTPGTSYGYTTSGCHGDGHKSLTNPKTVIIT